MTRRFVAFCFATFSLFGFGCGDSESVLPGTAPLVVKLVREPASDARVHVQAILYGTDTSLDMYTFAFDLKIGDTTVLAYAPSSAVAGDALQAFAGQSITTIVGPDVSDPSHIVVGVGKLGGGVGNGVAASSAVVVELAFDVLQSGVSTLAIATVPTPRVFDKDGVAIGAITFDSASVSVTGGASSGGR